MAENYDFLKDEVFKDLDQRESIDDDQVKKRLGEMGWLWDRVNQRLSDAAICFECKDKIDIEKGVHQLVEVTNIDKGAIAFVILCKGCIKKAQEKEKPEEPKNGK